MKVVGLRADAGACAKYRVIQPLAMLSRWIPDVEVDVRTYVDLDATRLPDDHIKVHEVKEDADVIVFQRPLARDLFHVIKQAQKQGIACVVELDDDFENVHPRNMSHSNMDPEIHPESNWTWVKRSCEIADHVIVSTRELADYAPHGRVSICGNYMADRDTRIEVVENPFKKSGPAQVGWTGTMLTHPSDLQVSAPGIAQAIRDTGASFYVVGDGVGVQSALRLPKSVPFGESGWTPLNEYLPYIKGMIDIGVVPLENSRFNRAKSFLKGMEFAAVGKPFVASPLPEYVRLRDEFGIGIIASTPSDWRRELTRLIKDPELAAELGLQWRGIVQSQLTIDKWFDGWDFALRQALRHRKAVQEPSDAVV